MKNLILLPLAVLSLSLLSAQAADTSGCSMKKTTQSKNTVFGKLVTVSNYKASEPGCWNAQDGKVVLSYQYSQEARESHKVIFWAKINGQEATINTNIACSADGGLSYGANTSGASYVNCTATAYIPTGYQETLNVEVAPQIDGTWDTYGFNQNYYFQF